MDYAKSQTGPSIDLRANLGLTQTGNTIDRSYADLLRNQSVTLGFYIPLIDWGVNRSNKKRAQANLDLQKASVSQTELNAEQQVVSNIMLWNMQQEQMQISAERSTLAQQRYDMLKQKYALGSISYTDFNNAQLEKDGAINSYIYNLRTYWTAYYTIRSLTLYDFENQKKIQLADLSFD